jgi:hypothetical protein
MAEYESIFEAAGWLAGLILPRHLGEAEWLRWAGARGGMMVSANRSGFSAVVMREGEPAMVRTPVCDQASIPDELHRFALYYRDRVEESKGAAGIERLMVFGSINEIEAQGALSDALGITPRLVTPAEFGFELAGSPIKFEQIASAAGMASMAWQ